ncbi:MAG: type II toxin-antitoxin system Phd/YefM family antitoxin [Thermomicrobiales bacterium]
MQEETRSKTVGAFEAKTQFSQLLDDVANGATVTITKHGVPVARLVPIREHGRPTPAEAIAAFREFRKRERITLGDLTIRELIEEGRM